jgi:Leucine-rich repeat (LRR) protein
MSDLELLRKLETAIGTKLEQVDEERFKLNLENASNFVDENAYALSDQGEVIGLYLRKINGNKLSGFLLSEFEQLAYLYLEDIQLENFLFLKEIKYLKVLGLVGNQLTDVSFLKELAELTSLDLRNNELTDVSFLKELAALTSLNLGFNNLTEVSFLKELTALTSLSLWDNNLTEVSFLKELTALTSLDLSFNKLTDVSFLKELTALTSLDLGGNKLTDISFLKELTGLTSLKLSFNKLTDVSFLKELTALTSLDLSYSQITDVSFLKELTALTSLNLSRNELTDLSFLKELTALTSLYLSSNELTDVSFLKELTALTSLNLGFNKLTEVSFLKELTALTFLDLINNQLTDVSFLKELTALTSLYLSNNQITDISFLKELTTLTSLGLKSNQITEIPRWLTEKGLEIQIDEEYASGCINLYDNPIENPPLGIVRQGNEAIRNYYDQIAAQGKDYLYAAKMLIVGEGEAGKTTLAHKIADPDCPLPHIDDRTRGITIHPHTFTTRAKDSSENREFQLNVWDFGGQEMYHATHRFFLSRRSLYVLVADNRKDNTDFNYWLNIIELFAGKSPIIILLNEKDDVQRNINQSEMRSRYPESIKEVVKLNFKTAEETDQNKRQTRLKKIYELINQIEHHSAHLPHIGEPVPAHWVDVKQAVETDERNHIYRQQFDQICHQLEITADQDIDTLLGYFHDLGIVLNFADSSFLKDRVILKPEWATNAIYRLFDNDQIKAKVGRFTRTDCIELWQEKQYQYMHDVLIELMKNFHLVYPITNTENLVAPQILPDNTPDYNWDESNNSLMQFRYDFFMPKGILWQFIVNLYRYIENHDWVWRNGVILKRGNSRAEIIENLFERRIYIRLSGKSIAELRAIITDELDTISKSYHSLKYEKMVPCKCSVCELKSDPHFFEYSALKERQEKGIKQTIECVKSGEDVHLLLLLEGFDLNPPKEEAAVHHSPHIPPIPANKTMKTIRIFLASSAELKSDREQFEIFINRKNKEYIKKEIFLELVLWEDFLDAMSATRLQDEYNKVIAECDIFVSLFHTKVGKYTEEEFSTAFATFKENNKPFIYTYFKDTPINMSKITSEILSLLNFREKLKELGHFQTIYADINDLKHQFDQQLIKLNSHFED